MTIIVVIILIYHGDDHEKNEDLNYLNSGIVALEEVDRLIGLRLADHHTVVVLLVLHVPPS